MKTQFHDPNSASDENVMLSREFGVGLPLLSGEIFYGDEDNDGYREYGAKASIKGTPFSLGATTEDPLRSLPHGMGVPRSFTGPKNENLTEHGLEALKQWTETDSGAATSRGEERTGREGAMPSLPPSSRGGGGDGKPSESERPQTDSGSWISGAWDWVQGGLDVASMAMDATGIGGAVSWVPDVLNAGISAGRGDWAGAGLSMAAAVPFAGAAANATRLSRAAAKHGDDVVDSGKAARAGSKTPLPKLKSSGFGSKIADTIPKKGVPSNWSKAQIDDAIADYKTSIASRKAELSAFDKTGGGSATKRRAHARRITEEETFLRSLEKAAENRR